VQTDGVRSGFTAGGKTTGEENNKREGEWKEIRNGPIGAEEEDGR